MHLIRQLSFETRASSRSTGEKLARKLPDLLTDSVIPKLDSYLDELPTEIDIRIEKLVCDIGPVSYSKLEQDLPRLIADALLGHFKQSLTQESPLLPQARKLSELVQWQEREKHLQSRDQSRLEAVLFFLNNGHLPWWFPETSWPDALLIADWPAAQIAELESSLIQSVRSGEVAGFHRFIRHVSYEAIAHLLEKNTFQIRRDFSPAQLATFQELRTYQRTAVLTLLWLSLARQSDFSVIPWENVSKNPDVTSLPTAIQSLLSEHLSSVSARKNTSSAPETLMPLTTKKSPAVAFLTALANTSYPSQETAAEEAPAELPSGFAISNAGLVLLHPFIPHLFQGLTWLDANKQILPAQRWHAVQALQYLSRGDTGFSEASMLLDKVLCGLPIAALAEEATLSPEVRAECDSLLSAAIKHWSILGNTSPAGLRESFLKRPGLLRHAADGCHLHIERQAIDVLLGHLPWPLSIIKLPWMNQPLHIIWV